VYVYPYDGAAYGNPGSDAVSVSNSLPVIDSVTIDPNPAYTDDDIVATPVGWYDGEGDPEKYAYAWYINEVLDASATTNTYPSSATIKGDTVRVIVTPSDPYGAGAAVSFRHARDLQHAADGPWRDDHPRLAPARRQPRLRLGRHVV
jgi:hypothetical protein